MSGLQSGSPLVMATTAISETILLRMAEAITAVSIHFGLMNTILHQSYVIYQNQTCVKLAKWQLLQNNEDRIFLKNAQKRLAISYLFYFIHFFSITVNLAGNCLLEKKKEKKLPK